jgi:spoIIIJ-associated protein
MNDSNDDLQGLDDDGWEDDDGDEGDTDGEAAESAEESNGTPAEAGEAGEERGRRRRRRRRNDTPREVLPEDERSRQALTFVTDVVREMGMDCRVRLRRAKAEGEQDEINIEIYGKDAGRIIGKKGQVLGALQFLVHRAINRPGQDRRHVLVDAEGYRSRRDDTLASMARRLGKQAVEQGKIITFEPMNPRDRRVVHLALAKFEGVITKSDGEGDERRVQIIPVRRSAS